ncbi:cupredoxin domain-containing protein [Shewanella rhizosphaerae]|uniref:cupredoxin domain-containing protein n=1 Tax=Shewanella rhizosphaerae TaxID=2864207 RepID=UPI001C655340|nr:cupredoxin domain-containing protein [Shewanella rhizosphaerae]QYK12926.1 cupredoxin domain-containing protein [Shewanella rhizosphaerae]
MLFINLFCLALIGFIVWWFWLYSPEAPVSQEGIEIVVKDGVYTPSRIKIPSGQATSLTFLRQDKSGCSATLQLPALEISEELALDKPTVIKIPAMTPGEYAFHCQMQMYKGVLVVE